MHKVRHHFFPRLTEWLGAVEDRRIANCCDYSMSEILMQAIYMYEIQGLTRNQMNLFNKYGGFFKENFEALHDGMRLAHFDTVNNVIKTVRTEDLIAVLEKMVYSLIRQKVIKPIGGYYHIICDASGLASYRVAPVDGAIHKTSKNNVVTYGANVLEAKIITGNGLCLSIGSELLSNEGKKEFDKQDCEHAAFLRLCDKIHKSFPRLAICIHLDGLYANRTVMRKCEEYGWKYIITRKEGSLPKLTEQITDTMEKEKLKFTHSEVLNPGQKKLVYGDVHYLWVDHLDHQGHALNYIEASFPMHNKPEVVTTFAYITNIDVDKSRANCRDLVRRLIASGRSRWLIENKGFNEQKNNGFNMAHKFVRKSIVNLHKYYILLQIAHIIYQLTVKSKEVVTMVQSLKVTFKLLWARLQSIITDRLLCRERLCFNLQRCQIRLE